MLKHLPIAAFHGIVLLLAGSLATAAEDVRFTDVQHTHKDSLAASPLRLALNEGNLPSTIEATLTNASLESVSVLTWNTPFESTLSDNVFAVMHTENQVPVIQRATYTGRHVKRAAATQDNFIQLAPGESITAAIDLSEHYDITAARDYHIEFDGHVQYEYGQTRSKALGEIGSMPEAHLHANSVSMYLTPSYSLRIRPPNYNNCSAGEQGDINAAAQVAEQLAGIARNDLTNLPANERASSPRYTTWFGAYDEGRYNRVLANFTAIEDALVNQTITYNCDCNEAGVFAYVFPSQPYDIWLCPAFRAANIDGTDSRAGTIIHELSHFQILADTDDHQYGQGATQQLAQSNPSLAIDNADSHEYFAENTPALAISGGAAPLPEDPGPQTPLNFQALTLNQPVTGTVAVDTFDAYSVAGAERLELTTTDGDADLFAYTDQELTNLICESDNAAALDSCDINTRDTIYIAVYGYEASSYSLVANGQAAAPQDPEPEPTTIPLTNLALNSSVDGQVRSGQPAGYRVEGNSLIRLESTNGNADMLVFNDTRLADDTLVCRSVEAGLSVDECDLPTAGTFYAAVATLDASADYRISLLPRGQTTPTPEPQPMPTPPQDPVTPIAQIPVAGGSGGSSGGASTPALIVLLSGIALYRRRKTPS